MMVIFLISKKLSIEAVLKGILCSILQSLKSGILTAEKFFFLPTLKASLHYCMPSGVRSLSRLQVGS